MAHGHEVHTQTVPDPEGCTMHAELAFDTGVIMIGLEAGEEGGRSRSVLGGGFKIGGHGPTSRRSEPLPGQPGRRAARRAPEISSSKRRRVSSRRVVAGRRPS